MQIYNFMITRCSYFDDSFFKTWIFYVTFKCEILRMINYLTGFDKTKANIVPHKVKDTLSVNHARSVIIQLSKPLADIAQLINDNICVLRRHRVALQRENLSKSQLESRLYVPVVNLKGVELKQPVTVCTNVKCCEIYHVSIVVLLPFDYILTAPLLDRGQEKISL